MMGRYVILMQWDLVCGDQSVGVGYAAASSMSSLKSMIRKEIKHHVDIVDDDFYYSIDWIRVCDIDNNIVHDIKSYGVGESEYSYFWEIDGKQKGVSKWLGTHVLDINIECVSYGHVKIVMNGRELTKVQYFKTYLPEPKEIDILREDRGYLIGIDEAYHFS